MARLLLLVDDLHVGFVSSIKVSVARSSIFGCSCGFHAGRLIGQREWLPGPLFPDAAALPCLRCCGGAARARTSRQRQVVDHIPPLKLTPSPIALHHPPPPSSPLQLQRILAEAQSHRISFSPLFIYIKPPQWRVRSPPAIFPRPARPPCASSTWASLNHALHSDQTR